MNTSRLVIKNQWASHPSTEDREAHLKGLNIQAEILDQSAWVFFSEPEKLQREMTEFIYEEVKFTSEPSLMNLDAFAKEYHEEQEHFSFDNTYRGFYDDRLFPKGEELSKAEDSTLDSILTEEVLGLSRKLNGIVADISVLEQIQQAPKDLKTFEFAGVKCFREEAASIITQLKEEKQTLTEKLKNADDKVYSYFLLRARLLNCEVDYRARHERILTLQKETENDVELYSNMMRIVTPLFQERVTFEKAYTINNQIKMNEEKLKERIKLFLSIPELETLIKKEKIKTLEDFVSEKRIYFDNSRLNDAALTLLMESLSIFYMIVIDNNHIEKKKLLAWQLTLK
ncbi:MAG: hypothetical protein JSS79_01010 [Bacteroidetes bacterium]|nr:hypothetical protein [Bacteroidota bacterium]